MVLFPVKHQINHYSKTLSNTSLVLTLWRVRRAFTKQLRAAVMFWTSFGEVLDWIIGRNTDYPKWCLSRFSSVSLGKFSK
jgi:hypothetical protein